MKSLFGVLGLVLVLVYSSQAEEHHACDNTLDPDELQKLHGDWVLVWALHDKLKSHELDIPNMTSSHIEIHVQHDNHTLVLHERNAYGGGKCASYDFNLTLPQSHEGHHRLDLMEGATESRDGVVKPYNDMATAEFFLTSGNSMTMFYKSNTHGFFLLKYRREGQHVDNLEKDHEKHRGMAKCLKLHGENYEEWHYDGSDFCHKKSVLPTLSSEELHQVDGDWVLIWMAYNKIKNKDHPVMNVTSSYMVIRLKTDNHTLNLHEHNFVGGKCISYSANLILPQSSERIHRLNMEAAMENIDGVEKPYNDTATAEFFPSSENTMEMYYKSENHGNFLLMYRKERQHLEDLKKDHEAYRAKAKYLGLSGTNFAEWHYDGVTELCHKKAES